MDIYKCEINGVTTFSDIKCAPDAKTISSSTKKQEAYPDYPVMDGSNDSTYIRSPHNSNSGSTIYTGPRGGKFYYNKNGNKTYIRHK
jgi:colicin import membrane protein